MRLNKRTSARVTSWMKEIIPCDLDPERTIALPIRASDKCIGEYRLESGFGVGHIGVCVPFSFHFHFSCLYQTASYHNLFSWQGETSCASFQIYMELADIIREHDPRVDTILLSSEDARFVEARHNYSKEVIHTNQRHPWRFILNTKDVMQGSGDRQQLGGHTVDEVFMSFYTTLQMQVRGVQREIYHVMGSKCRVAEIHPNGPFLSNFVWWLNVHRCAPNILS